MISFILSYRIFHIYSDDIHVSIYLSFPTKVSVIFLFLFCPHHSEHLVGTLICHRIWEENLQCSILPIFTQDTNPFNIFTAHPAASVEWSSDRYFSATSQDSLFHCRKALDNRKVFINLQNTAKWKCKASNIMFICFLMCMHMNEMLRKDLPEKLGLSLVRRFGWLEDKGRKRSNFNY